MSADALRSLSSTPRLLQIYTPVYAGQYTRMIYNMEQRKPERHEEELLDFTRAERKIYTTGTIL